MPRSILVDVNVPREVCERLSEVGFDTKYVTDVFPEDTDDEKILDWIKRNRFILLTKDKNFPGNGYKIILRSESTVKLSRESFDKLTKKKVFPRALTGSWKCDGKAEDN